MYTIEIEDLSKSSKTIVVESNTSPVQAVNGLIGFVSVNPLVIGLGNVNNTSDMDKPVSFAVSGAIVSLKQEISSNLASLEERILSQVQLSSSEDIEFQVGLYSGIDSLNVYYPRNLSQRPKSVTCSIENNIDNLIYNYFISDVTKIGFNIEFSDYLSSDGYILHVVASI